MCRIFRKIFSKKKNLYAHDKDLQVHTNLSDSNIKISAKVSNTDVTDKMIISSTHVPVSSDQIDLNQEVRFYTTTELLQRFFHEYNQWIKDFITIDFSKFYVSDYQKRILQTFELLAEKDKHLQQLQAELSQNCGHVNIIKSSFDLYATSLEFSNYSKQVLHKLKEQMDKVKSIHPSNDDLINKLRDSINELRYEYNSKYDIFSKKLTPLRLNFMKAIENYTQIMKVAKSN